MGIAAVWSSILGLIERRWDKLPRREVARAVVALRKAMEECLGSYEELRRADTSRARWIARLSWQRAIGQLALSLGRVSTTLRIFSPEASRKIEAYYHRESVEFDKELIAGVIDAVAEAVERRPGIEVEAGTVSDNFLEAVAELDAFIRSTFSVEEIHDAERSLGVFTAW